ncbi:unnamed protein product [Blepharisma stoltei]|uniref:Uncharacterized protein n=1 Tax=Blepharisma stoltei TaxID=1481888 RepID=A0AAU9K7E2_9CILI|nr:unnamed protein product [Blepharisma stoltei]
MEIFILYIMQGAQSFPRDFHFGVSVNNLNYRKWRNQVSEITGTSARLSRLKTFIIHNPHALQYGKRIYYIFTNRLHSPVSVFLHVTFFEFIVEFCYMEAIIGKLS